MFQQFARFAESRKGSLLRAAGVMVFALVGVWVLTISHAATPSSAVEAENGTRTGNVAAVTDTTASGGSGVRFGSTGSSALPGLSRIPWEGGPQYWAQFPKAQAGGWTNPNFFPITVFLGKPSTAYATLYKNAGVNTYAPPEADLVDGYPSSITNSGMYMITGLGDYSLSQLNQVGNQAVGWFLSDECDMGLGCSGSSSAAWYTQQQQYASQARSNNDGRFIMANFGNGIVRTYWSTETDPNTGVTYMADQERLVDVASADKYTYTSPSVWGIVDDCAGNNNGLAGFQGWHNSPDWPDCIPVARAYSYGWQADQMRRFQDPNHLHPVWTFIETARPFLTEDGSRVIAPEQMEGAVWSALIHEARGISYFDHNDNDSGTIADLGGNTNLVDNKGCQGYYAIVQCANVDCTGANASQAKCTQSTIKCASDDTACANGSADKNGYCVTSDVWCFVKTVDEQVQALAPVLNTQSYYNTTRTVNGFTYYQYNFGNGTDTMLKTYNGAAYIFAGLGMHCTNTSCTSGTADSTGSKTFTLPAGITGTTVTVVGEGRTLPVTNGTFTDTFAAEYSHHIYQITL